MLKVTVMSGSEVSRDRSLNYVTLREQNESVLHTYSAHAHACVNIRTICDEGLQIAFLLAVSLSCGSQVSQVCPELGTYAVHSKPPMDASRTPGIALPPATSFSEVLMLAPGARGEALMSSALLPH